MTTHRSIALITLLLSALGAAACETTSMSAKAGPDELSAAPRNACERNQNFRSACDDQVGCYWDSTSNSCAAH